ncbi:hypothetical protein C8R46DRAFT_1287901 [Mycena filopes]|nr:hypothetical protein C8R46DRAFT_1287901 [Mycena filopes]
MEYKLTLLPPELWLAILASLYLPDLVSFSATCSSFQSLAVRPLEVHKTLRARYHSAGYNLEDSWYSLLLAILREPAAAYYIEDLEVEQTERDLAHQPVEDSDAPWTVTPADAALIRRAVEVDTWIPETDKERILERLLEYGDENAAVTLLVLRLPNLRRLSLPTYGWGELDSENLMPIVTRIAQAGANVDEGGVASPSLPLPLSRLEHYEGHVFDGRGINFESIAPIMVLPSLRSLSTSWNHEEEGFDWPATLLKSNVREIRIDNGTVVLKTILRLARGIRGPCVIGQKWGFRMNADTPVRDWDSLEIPFEGAGQGDWVITGAREMVQEIRST